MLKHDSAKLGSRPTAKIFLYLQVVSLVTTTDRGEMVMYSTDRTQNTSMGHNVTSRLHIIGLCRTTETLAALSICFVGLCL